MPIVQTLRPWLALSLLCAAGAAFAQTSPAPARAASAPARAASAPPRAAAPPASAASSADGAQRVEINGSRESDTDQRRRATATKIVIGREEIDKFGDATVGEVLRRLPGVTTPGAPGRGGPPRLRGLGNGFTQLLIDGQRIPPGFSLESLTPEQVERIEILRAPTAETGARAIAGTINIVTREGYKRRVNDVRLGFGYENGKVSPGAFWTHNDSSGGLTYNLSGSLLNPHRLITTTTRTTLNDVSSGTQLEDRTSTTRTTEDRTVANLTTRLQWQLDAPGNIVALTPFLFHTEGRSNTTFSLNEAQRQVTCAPGQVSDCTPLFYDHGDSHGSSDFTNGRFNGLLRRRVGPVRLELNGGGGIWRAHSDSLRSEYAASANATPLRTLQDHAVSRENSGTLNLKASTLLGGDDGGSAHDLVSGIELDSARRNDTRISLQNGQPLLVDFGDNLQASSLRTAAYAQDEWSLTPNWAMHAGLRWEGITTRGDSGDGTHPENRSSVWTPLLHAVWKPDPKGRDQVRFSLTRSYRAPPLGSLIARPSINRDFDPLVGSNRPTSPDSAGNPNLKPELATGIDIALERYLDAGGVLSANVFRRNISNLMRGATTLETVSWSPYPRYVRRQQNIGDATASGIEVEAKFRLDQLITGATPIELRSNLSMYASHVKSLPGPDNRLDQQSKATANVGGDYRLRGTPLTLGGNLNWVPGYTTQVDIDQSVAVTMKRIWDVYGLWTFNPAVGVRLLANNLAPRDYATTTVNDALVGANGTQRTTVRTAGSSYTNWQLRLELKL